jgi:hypothetical protein
MSQILLAYGGGVKVVLRGRGRDEWCRAGDVELVRTTGRGFGSVWWRRLRRMWWLGGCKVV